jgi:hypothetical protein
LAKYDTQGVDSMTLFEKKRLKKLITKEKIKNNNLMAGVEK